jgi:enamine deaminase RidA (YjgF/YER057c/UK114 family)/phenylpyruvate tautomerase PptA (4-oxalocrotonate tautomerase family)
MRGPASWPAASRAVAAAAAVAPAGCAARFPLAEVWMPILDVTIVEPVDHSPRELSSRIADRVGDALDARAGGTWVRLRLLPGDAYAESGGAPAGVRPVFVELTLREWPPTGAARASSARAVAQAVADACGRPVENVHVILAPPGAGRVAFGGELLPGPERGRVSSDAKWEAIVGYSRAVRAGDLVFVTGTTAFEPGGGHAAADDAAAQTRQAISNIAVALERLGAALADVVRTRMYVIDIERDWEAVGRAHAEAFALVRPATTMVEVRRLIEPWMRVEIEADAVAR